jgi:error-prone DNA polymerase
LIDFVHLHVASSYSLRYGTASPAALAAAAKERGMPALALTDRDGLYGAFKHAQACKEAGIAPILGADLRAAPGRAAPGRAAPGRAAPGRAAPGRAAPGRAAPGRAAHRSAVAGSAVHGPGVLPGRVTMLAVGRRGWASLCALVSSGRPATPAAGLVVLLGPDSDVGRAVAARRPDLAEAALRRWRDAADSAASVVIEITDQYAPGDTRRARALLRFARETGTPAVLTNPVRYLDPADSPVAQVLDAARANVPLGTPGLLAHNGQAHLASPAEMAAVAAGIAGETGAALLLEDTARLARRCYLDPGKDLGIGTRHLPEARGDLRESCELGLRGYRGDRARARQRLDHELNIIADTALAPYFLTVADIARRIKANGIRCAIRGSGAGSLVNHLLGISAVDPLEHDLLMERFLSHTRETMPDIDLDVESARRIEAYRVILAAYGEQRCATVCMMETYRARSAIRDAGAAFGLPRTEIDAIAKAFPHIRAAHIGAALTELPELKDSRLSIPQLTGLFWIAERLDGLPRHVAMHPCGVLLSDATLQQRTAVTRSSADDLPLSQLDKDDAETAGVIKLDVLGVRMQSAMACALTQIPGDPIDLDRIPRDDEPTFEMIRKARTIGCFQIESPGQRELVTRVAPRRIGDLIAEISLFRPGPVNSDMITPFLAVRNGTQDATYPHESLRAALAETGGVVIYHEQVLRIIDLMTGCGLPEADRIRRRLSVDQPESWFREAAARRGHDEATITAVWDVLAAFGAFGFCKAHAAAFAIPVYQSAWLKRHHPAAFYAGVLTHDPGMYPKRVIVADARLAGVPVLGPDVNASAAGWHVQPPFIRTSRGSSPALRVSLREVKGITDAEVTRIVAGQPYRSLRDFTERARVSRPVAERLILVGAFDSLYSRATRRDLVARLGVLTRPVRQETLTLDLPGDGLAELVPAGELRELDARERVAAELDILGFDVSEHVLGFYTELLDGLGVVRSDRLHRCGPGSTVLVAGVKVATQTPAIRSGQRIIFASLDDAAGLVDLAFFESVQDRCAATLFGSWLLLVRGRVRRVAPGAVTVSAADCWDLRRLEEIRAEDGIAAVHATIAAAPAGNDGRRRRLERDEHAAAKPLVYPTGFTLSPYAETGSPGPPLKAPPRNLWHAGEDSEPPLTLQRAQHRGERRQVGIGERAEGARVIDEIVPEPSPEGLAFGGEDQGLDPPVARIGAAGDGTAPLQAVHQRAEVGRVVVEPRRQVAHRDRLARRERQQRPHLAGGQADGGGVRGPLLPELLGDCQQSELRVERQAQPLGARAGQVRRRLHGTDCTGAIGAL